MASSNRHWPSMFKSKPCNNPPHHQWQQQHHDINSSLISTACHRSPPYTSGTGTGIGIGSCEERSPEPKPRWNPKPEQIRILEAIFNSGMVNPPRDEIRKIRAQLQEYGQVGDANVFYWFQNRKSRSKHKLRHLHNKTTTTLPPPPPPQNSSSNSSSEKSSPKQEAVLPTKVFSIGFSNVTDVVPNSPTATSVTYFHTHNNETVGSLAPPPLAVAVTTPPAEAFFFPAGVQQHQGMVVPNTSSSSQGFCFSELSNVVQGQPHASHAHGPCTSLLLSEIMSHHAGSSSCCTTTTSKKDHHHHHHDHDHDEEHDKSSSSSMKIVMQQHTAAAAPHLSFSVTPPSSSSSTTSSHHHHHTRSATVAPPIPIPIPIPATTVTVPSQFITQLQGGDGGGVAAAAKSTVFINDVAFEVAVGPFNVREAFGDDALLIHSSGHPVLTNPWGLTLHSLHHGASYYLI